MAAADLPARQRVAPRPCRVLHRKHLRAFNGRGLPTANTAEGIGDCSVTTDPGEGSQCSHQVNCFLSEVLLGSVKNNRCLPASGLRAFFLQIAMFSTTHLRCGPDGTVFVQAFLKAQAGYRYERLHVSAARDFFSISRSHHG